MKYLYWAIYSLIITVGIILGVYYFLPMGLFEKQDQIGSTITTILGSDTLSASRSVINTNFTNLNAGKVENATTSMSSITTLSNLVSIGTLTTGTWNATAISVAKGGSGTTTPSRYQVILGDGSLGFTVASSTGTTGQFLTSNGSGAYPTWQNSTVNQTSNYLWTGLHNFTGTTLIKTLNASSTIVINGVSYAWPVLGGLANNILSTDGAGNLTWATSTKIYSTSTISFFDNTASTTPMFATTTIAANTLGTGNVIKIKAYIRELDLENSQNVTISLKYGTTIIASVTIGNSTNGTVSSMQGWVDAVLMGGGATNSQIGYLSAFITTGSGNIVDNLVDANTSFDSDYGTASVDSTATQNIILTAAFSAASPNNFIRMGYAFIEIIK